jgi:hypothetical protein
MPFLANVGVLADKDLIIYLSSNINFILMLFPQPPTINGSEARFTKYYLRINTKYLF